MGAGTFPRLYRAKAVVLATGRYREGPTRLPATAGSTLWNSDRRSRITRVPRSRDMEFVQFHPTGMIWPPSVRGILVTEGVRGEGGVLTEPRRETVHVRRHSGELPEPRRRTTRRKGGATPRVTRPPGGRLSCLPGITWPTRLTRSVGLTRPALQSRRPRRRRRHVSRLRPGRCPRGGRRARQGRAEWAAVAPERRAAILESAAAQLESALGGADRRACPRGRQDHRRGHDGGQPDAGEFAVLCRRGHPNRRFDLPGRRCQPGVHAAGTRRHRRRDHAVELPAQHSVTQARSRARRR